MLSKPDLFARLAEGHAAGVTIVTPNKRLSQALMAEFDLFQIDKQLTVWEAPDILLKEPAAQQCREAWRLLHQWRIGTGGATEDATAFSSWSKEYQRNTAGEVDAARLPDLMAQHLGSLKKPKLLVAYAFDVMPPQT